MLEVSSSIPRIALNDLVLVASANTLGCAKQVPSSLSTPPSKICLTISVLITYDWNCVFTLRPDYCSNLSCNINRWGTLIRKRILQLLNPHLKTRQGYTELWYFNGAWRNIFRKIMTLPQPNHIHSPIQCKPMQHRLGTGQGTTKTKLSCKFLLHFQDTWISEYKLI